MDAGSLPERKAQRLALTIGFPDVHQVTIEELVLVIVEIQAAMSTHRGAKEG